MILFGSKIGTPEEKVHILMIHLRFCCIKTSICDDSVVHLADIVGQECVDNTVQPIRL